MTKRAIENYLKNLANEEVAHHSEGFFKTGKGEYGYGDKFLGIRVPLLRQAVKKFKETSLTTIEELLKSKFHEIRLFALIFLVHHFSKSVESIRKEIFQIYLDNLKHVNNWDLVDGSAHHIIGAYLEDKEKSLLYELLKSSSLWERRIAIISTFYYIKNNQFKDTLKIAKLLLNDQEDLIHKAVGWMLREIGNRDKSVEEKFLKSHYQKMPRTMLRYAIERFSKIERQRYLNGEF